MYEWLKVSVKMYEGKTHSPYYVPSTVLGHSYVIFRTALRRRYHSYPLLKDEDTKSSEDH